MNLRGWQARDRVCERGDHPWKIEDVFVRVPITYDGRPALGWIEARVCPWCGLRWKAVTMVEVEHV